MTGLSIRPIQTAYKGRRFRSRLEARWAVFFDAMGIPWQYETEGFEFADGMRYLPDFFLPGFHDKRGLYVEVKGPDGDLSKPRRLAAEAGWPVLLAVGEPALCWFEVADSSPAATTRVCFTRHARHESRLWECPARGDEQNDEARKAVQAALSARFEHGESGAWI